MKLYSDSYIEMLEPMVSDHGMGNTGPKYKNQILEVYKEYACTNMLDYGAGWGSLKDSLQPSTIPILEYEATRKDTLENRIKSDLLVCVDVLEHIELPYLENVFNDLKALTGIVSFITISTRASSKLLPDGRNAHLIIKPRKFWLKNYNKYFNTYKMTENVDTIILIGNPK